MRPGQDKERTTESAGQTKPDPPGVKVIAFYLPQFHPIPENDEWWGVGFTEWRNVTGARPNFVGHYQPHVPADLGYYDLRLSEVREAQAELAKAHGLFGFCYHYYWFSGKRLLHRPLDEVFESKTPDFPFCVCWANENWTRRWDGLESEILIAQEHGPADDSAFIEDLMPLFRDHRYIHIQGRPLLIVYSARTMRAPQKTTDTWRKACVSAGLPEPYLCIAQAFGTTDPISLGFDAAVEFPPHFVVGAGLNHALAFTNPDYKGSVYAYEDAILSSLRVDDPAYPLFRTVMPSWDNTARMQNGGSTFVGATPERYEFWLSQMLDWSVRRWPEDGVVFVNAWNEWAEGCHLEPDEMYGHRFLAATRDAVHSTTPKARLLQRLERDLRESKPVSHQTIEGVRTLLDGRDRSLRVLTGLLREQDAAPRSAHRMLGVPRYRRIKRIVARLGVKHRLPAVHGLLRRIERLMLRLGA